jgi:hypothetical protein
MRLPGGSKEVQRARLAEDLQLSFIRTKLGILDDILRVNSFFERSITVGTRADPVESQRSMRPSCPSMHVYYGDLGSVIMLTTASRGGRSDDTLCTRTHSFRGSLG